MGVGRAISAEKPWVYGLKSSLRLQRCISGAASPRNSSHKSKSHKLIGRPSKWDTVRVAARRNENRMKKARASRFLRRMRKAPGHRR